MNNAVSTKLHFPARLYQVIEIEDPTVVTWDVSGKAFRIVDSKRFRTETIPKYFRHGNMASLQRQLNLYGFRCTNRVDEKGVFHHPDFARGQYDKVRMIRRKKTWPTKKKPRGGPDAEEDEDEVEEREEAEEDEARNVGKSKSHTEASPPAARGTGMYRTRASSKEDSCSSSSSLSNQLSLPLHMISEEQEPSWSSSRSRGSGGCGRSSNVAPISARPSSPRMMQLSVDTTDAPLVGDCIAFDEFVASPSMSSSVGDCWSDSPLGRLLSGDDFFSMFDDEEKIFCGDNASVHVDAATYALSPMPLESMPMQQEDDVDFDERLLKLFATDEFDGFD